MPYKDPEVRRVKQAEYQRRWESKPDVKARRRKYKRDLLSRNPEYAESQRESDRAYNETHRLERRAYAAEYRSRPENYDRRYEQIKEWQSAARSVTDAAAHRKGSRWSAEEDAIVSDLSLTHVEVALLTGRTYGAINHRRRTLRRQAVSESGQIESKG